MRLPGRFETEHGRFYGNGRGKLRPFFAGWFITLYEAVCAFKILAISHGIIHPGGQPLRDWTDRFQSQADPSQTTQSRVRRLIEGASQRRTLVLTVEHSAFAVAAVGGGAALMLLLGTQILNWPWLVLLAVAGLAITYVRLRKRIFSRYRVAQIIDRRLQLSDSLSTAWFLLQDPERSEKILAQAQISSAEQAARQVDNAAVFPFVWGRTWALAVALAAVAFGLFTLRYLVTSSLDLKRSFLPLPFSSITEVWERIEKMVQHGTPEQTGIKGNQPGLRRGAGPERNEKLSQTERPPEQTSGNSGDAASDKDKQPLGASLDGEKNSSASLDRKEAGQNSSDRSEQAKRGQPSPGYNSPEKEAQNNETHLPSTGLVDRMKDALSGLMAKMHAQNGVAKKAEQERGKQDSKPSEQSAENKARNEQMQQEAPSSQENQGAGREQSARNQSGAEASEKSPGTQGHSSDDSANRKGSDAHSGIGRQDGEKTLKEAEQLRAMGKLDEIIGKRSANLTGDVTVETQSNHQHLQTQYSGRVAQHSDLGGEIERDHVPVALQRYVREYMDQVRKQANNER